MSYSSLNRLGKFLRSVIPADPWQLAFLAGVAFIFVSARAPLWSEESVRVSSFRAQFPPTFVLWAYPLSFAGIAGYFICFWPGPAPVRRIVCLVILPAFAALCFISVRIPEFIDPDHSVLESSGSTCGRIGWPPALLGKLSPGIGVCSAGLLLIGLFAVRMVFEKSDLPLSLPAGSRLQERHFVSWERIKYMVWFLGGPVYILDALLFGPVYLLLVTGGPAAVALIASPWSFRIATVVESIAFVSVALLFMGKAGPSLFRQCVRLPEPRFVLLGLVLPVGFFQVVPVARYLLDRSQWAAHGYGKLEAPLFGSYLLPLPGALLLWMGFGALTEEIVFRGLLQPSLLRRYGLYPGIFLTNMVWSASHFRTDTYSHLLLTGVVAAILTRICFCIAMGYVLAWLTLRSGSVFPAAAAHTLSNMWAASYGPHVRWSPEIRIALWAAAACLLFRFWPVTIGPDASIDSPVISPEPAV